jgi:hypothetical protein
VRHRANPKFWKFYEQLPNEIQKLADANYKLLKRDPRHPSLHFKKVAECGQRVLASIIELLVSRTAVTSSGSGLGIIASTTG